MTRWDLSISAIHKKPRLPSWKPSFEACVSRGLPADQISRLFDELGRFASLGSIRHLTALGEPLGLPANQAAD